MDENKINQKENSKLQKLLETPTKNCKPLYSKDMFELIKKSEENLTVHLYSTGNIVQLRRRRNESKPDLYYRKFRKEKFLDYEREISCQIYFTKEKEKIYYLVTHSGSSGKRAEHNQMIYYFLKNKDLRKKIKTSIAIIDKQRIIKSYNYENFSYMDFSIGWQGYHNVFEILKNSQFPHSGIEYPKNDILLGERKIYFNNNQNKKIIYKTPKIKNSNTKSL